MSLSLPRWIVHRGGGCLAPENTLAGIRRAAALGFAAVEFDVMLSGDGTPVLIHDETLERTTNGRGRVADTPDAVLFALDAGGEPVPGFVDAARLCRELGLLANVEIKPSAGADRATAEAVVRLAGGLWRGAERLLLLSSFSQTALDVARDLAPELARGLLFEMPPADWADVAQRLQVSSLHVAAAAFDGRVAAEAAERGLPVLCYTVDAPAEAEMLFARGAAALFTDRPDRFAAETAAYKRLHPDG